MDNYYLITIDPDGGRFFRFRTRIDVLETEELCNTKLIERENKGFRLLTLIKGKKIKGGE